MKTRLAIVTMLLALATGMALSAAAKTKTSGGNDVPATGSVKDTPAAAAPAAQAVHDDSWRIEGEKRFRSNCGRCHTAPPKFPPRIMGTIVRHMRVRATITDEDMRLILRYMTQ